MQEALKIQKTEFLELELKESKRREEELKQLNSRLIEALKSAEEETIQDQLIQELQKANSQLESELVSLKHRLKTSESTISKLLKNRENRPANTQPDTIAGLQASFYKENTALREQNAQYQAKIKLLTSDKHRIEQELGDKLKFLESQLRNARIEKERNDLERNKLRMALEQCTNTRDQIVPSKHPIIRAGTPVTVASSNSSITTFDNFK